MAIEGVAMSVPGFVEVMRPWLELASDGQEHVLQEVISTLPDQCKLTYR